MSTRGYVGVRKNEEDKGGYNHFDSYPSSLGADVIMFLTKTNIEELKQIFISLSNEENTNKEDIWDWYGHCINRNAKNYTEFLKDSLFCEWAYIINLDTNCLEIYRGFNKDANGNGRYAQYTISSDEEEPYYGVVLLMEIPIDEIKLGAWKVTDDDKFVKVK